MSLRLHEIAEAHHRILNPFTEEKLMLLGEVCRLRPGMRQLDLCSGKGEMLCQWARRWETCGIGVDLSEVFCAAARVRAAGLGVADRVTILHGDASAYRAEAGAFDVVSCIGVTWIGNGLTGTLELMLPALTEDGLVLVGEPYWTEPPPREAYAAIGLEVDDHASLAGTCERCESAGLELVEMVLASQDSWDLYAAGRWWAMDEWLRTHPGHADAPGIREMLDHDRRAYLTYGRRWLGWGVFVLKRRPRT
ncbi:MAG: class I SAM-dependent methyltransferase [Deltaproteobacteria bacterium]|nr:class I SAM-dependent methyltransferase [Deltaproteobacteria bacterium]